MASAAKKARVLRTPADEVEDLVEQQRAQRDKMKELQRRHEAEKEDLRRRQEAEMEGLRGEEAELKRLFPGPELPFQFGYGEHGNGVLLAGWRSEIV